MRANRGRDTVPELAVRKRIHAAGLRYRVNARPEPDIRRTVDLLFRGPRVAVLIDGCFWHGCPEHHQAPRANADFWSTKIQRNRARDAETTVALTARGWRVLRFWEHEVRTDADAVAVRIIAIVREKSTDALPEKSVEHWPEEAGHLPSSDDERAIKQ
jgi:DNA mismatch endonuclease (patch repair protein)